MRLKNLLLDPLSLSIDFGMACMANFDLFMESKASDFHSTTHEHVLTTTHWKAKVMWKEKHIDN